MACGFPDRRGEPWACRQVALESAFIAVAFDAQLDGVLAAGLELHGESAAKASALVGLLASMAEVLVVPASCS